MEKIIEEIIIQNIKEIPILNEIVTIKGKFDFTNQIEFLTSRIKRITNVIDHKITNSSTPDNNELDELAYLNEMITFYSQMILIATESYTKLSNNK